MNKEKQLERIKLYLLDMDGTLWLGNRLFDFTNTLLDTLKQSGRRYLFMTNNSSRSVDDYVRKLAELGVSSVREDFITSTQATTYYLKEHHPPLKLYVCGTESLKRELREEGFSITEKLEEVECVIVGFDTELTFQKLTDVCRLLSEHPEMPYIATHPDCICPTEFGNVPDCGSICDMIFNATGKRPVVIGKPCPLMLELAMKRYGFTKEETAIVGDRIYTDVKSGLNAGVTVILVMSGETTVDMLNASADKPHYVFENAGEIISIYGRE